MPSSLKLALISAFPAEIVNFWVVGYPAGPDSLSSASQNSAVAFQWYVFHLTGILTCDHFVYYLRDHARLDFSVLFFSGYIDTAVFLALLLWSVRLACLAVRKLSFS